MKRSLPFLISSALFSLSSVASGTYFPRSFWEFTDPANPGADSRGTCPINFSSYSATYTVDGDGAGIVDHYLTNITKNALGCDFPSSASAPMSAASVEFMIKPGALMNQTSRSSFILGNSYFSFSIARDSLTFRTSLKDGPSDNFVVNFEGVGRLSPTYLLDGAWHHIALTYNAVTGLKQIWIDGQKPNEFEKVVTPNGPGMAIEDRTNNLNRMFSLGTNTSYDQAKASLDQVALYETDIPATLIYEHFVQAKNGQSYSFVDGGTPPPLADTTSAPIDPQEFPPGETFPTQIIPNPYQGRGNIMTTGISVEPLEQLKSYPLPRYKPGNTLHRIVPWYNSNYVAGQQLRDDRTNAVIAKEVQREAALKWNHMLDVRTGGNSNVYNSAYIDLANDLPNIPVHLTTYWAQLDPLVQILRKDLPASCYLNGSTTLSPAITDLAPAEEDGLNTRGLIKSTVDLLTNRPATKKIDHIDENGELLPVWSQTQVQTDPDVTADKLGSGISDWKKYLGNRWARIVQHYRDQFMGGATSRNSVLPGLENTQFSHYYIDGYGAVDYSEARALGTPVNSMNYATPDMYVARPWWWDKFSGDIHGLGYIDIARRNEIALGDKLFAPYVNACFEKKEEDCVRPAQYLGMLKILSTWGAEYFYAGYFSTKSPWPDPKGWTWQIVMPSYAQGITSRYEDFLREGSVVAGDALASPQNVSEGNGLRIWAGKSNIFVSARKMNDSEKYLITGMVGGYSNMIGAVPPEETAKIKLGTLDLSFQARRQGSVYVFDNTTPNTPVFYQLDDWHQYQHPARWSSDFRFQAEVHDESSVEIATERPSGVLPGDFRNFTSYLKFTSTSDVTRYRFTPRTAAFSETQSPSTTYSLYVRARPRTGMNGTFNFTLKKGSTVVATQKISLYQSGWAWYRAEALGDLLSFQNLTTDEHELSVSPSNGNLDLDEIVLSPNGGFLPADLLYPKVTDTTAPTVTLNSPSDNVSISGITPLSATATDNVAVTSVRFFQNGTLISVDSKAPFTSNLDTTAFANGTRTLSVKAYDAAGNIGSSVNTTVTIANAVPDTTKPTVSLSAPLKGTTVSGVITLTANATDNKKILRVRFLYGTTLIAQDATFPYTATLDTRALPNGKLTLKATAVDAANNTATSTLVSVTVANP